MFGKEAQPVDASSRAAARRLDGHTIYVATLLAVQLREWGDIIENVEAAGWKLESVTSLPAGNSQNAVAVFRAKDNGQ
jgi:hypothetical protein